MNFDDLIGKTVAEVTFNGKCKDDSLSLRFTDGTEVTIGSRACSGDASYLLQE